MDNSLAMVEAAGPGNGHRPAERKDVYASCVIRANMGQKRMCEETVKRHVGTLSSCPGASGRLVS